MSWNPITPAEQEDFLEALRTGCTVVEAARRAGRLKNGLYRRRRKDEKFREAWDAALQPPPPKKSHGVYYPATELNKRAAVVWKYLHSDPGRIHPADALASVVWPSEEVAPFWEES